MSDNSAAGAAQSGSKARPYESRGLLAWAFRTISRVMGILFFAAFISIIVEWIGMTWFWPEENYQHAQDMFATELGYLRSGAGDGTAKAGIVREGNEILDTAIRAVFVDSGVLNFVQKARTVSPYDNYMIALYKEGMIVVQDYLLAAIFVMMTFLVRIAILLLSFPIFILFGFVALMDGLVMRDLRKYRAAHESSFVYHIAKSIALPLMITGCILYLSMPFSIHPNLVITPFAALFAYTLAMMAAKFKKYL